MVPCGKKVGIALDAMDNNVDPDLMLIDAAGNVLKSSTTKPLQNAYPAPNPANAEQLSFDPAKDARLACPLAGNLLKAFVWHKGSGAFSFGS